MGPAPPAQTLRSFPKQKGRFFHRTISTGDVSLLRWATPSIGGSSHHAWRELGRTVSVWKCFFFCELLRTRRGLPKHPFPSLKHAYKVRTGARPPCHAAIPGCLAIVQNPHERARKPTSVVSAVPALPIFASRCPLFPLLYVSSDPHTMPRHGNPFRGAQIGVWSQQRYRRQGDRIGIRARAGCVCVMWNETVVWPSCARTNERTTKNRSDHAETKKR